MRDALEAPPPVTVDRSSIAVLPFTSRSTDPQNQLFTDGIHDDLLTRLANVSSLKVISRTSVMEYQDTTKNLREIAEELGVGVVLEGAVQRAGDSVRITAQLIDASTDEHIWANSYDRQLSAANLFAIQSEISEEITRALKATLTDDDEAALALDPAYAEAYTGLADSVLLLLSNHQAISADEAFDVAEMSLDRASIRCCRDVAR
jgi:TolB-like protein